MNGIPEATHFEITHGDPWKSGRREPIISGQALLDHINSIGMEICIQKDVQKEKLADGVGDVKQFADKVQHDQVVALVSTAQWPEQNSNTAVKAQRQGRAGLVARDEEPKIHSKAKLQ